MTGRAHHQAPWPIRAVPPALRDRYLDSGVWTDETLGALVDRSLAAAPDATINVWSESRPWHGTYSDVHSEAMQLLGVLRAEGLEAGDVVVFQLPNWREAIVAFYALAMGGYVLVPIVHIYGPKEVRFILAECGAARVPLSGSVRSRRLPRHHRRRLARSIAPAHPARRHR